MKGGVTKIIALILVSITAFSVGTTKIYAETDPAILAAITKAQQAAKAAQNEAVLAQFAANEARGIANRGVGPDGKTPLTPDQLAKVEQDATNAEGYMREAQYAAEQAAAKQSTAESASTVSEAETAANEAQSLADWAKDRADKAVSERDKALADGGGISLEQSRAAAASVDDAACFSVRRGLQPDVCFKEIAGWISYALLILVSWMLWLAGTLFDFVLDYTVIHMKDRVGSISGIAAGWKMVRDLGNLTFIFILLYAAIKTILGIENWDTKQIIKNIIIAGLLVNFSLFFTKVLIDTSNVLSIAFYNKIVTFDPAIKYDPAKPVETGVTTAFMKSLGLEKIFSPATFSEAMARGTGDWIAILVTGVGGAIFIIITAFAFLYAAVLFTIRFIALIMLMVLSPLPYFAFILPATKKHASQWWDALIGQLVFAPLYLLLMYITLSFAYSVSIAGGSNIGATFNPKAENVTGGLGATFNFVLIIGFLIFSAVIATRAAASSGGIIGRAVNRVNKSIGADRMKGVARGMTVGVGGAAARGTIGRGGLWVDDKLKNTAFGNSRFGEWVRKGTTGAVAGAQFGTSKSAAKIHSEGEARQKKYADIVEKDAAKEADKRAENKDELSRHRDADITNYEQSIRAKENLAEAARARVNTVGLSEKEKERAKREAERHENDLKNLERRLEETRERRRTGAEATSEERAAFTKIVREEREQELRSSVNATELPSRRTQAKRAFKLAAAGALIAGPAGAAVVGGTYAAQAIIRRVVRWAGEGDTARDARKAAADRLRDRNKGKQKTTDEVLADIVRQQSSGTGGGAPTTPSPNPINP